MRLKTKDIPILRDKIAISQDGKCWICRIDLRCVTPALDHDHKTGLIRSVLCTNCNAMEGKLFNVARRGKRQRTEMEFVKSIVAYWEHHAQNPRQEFHPNHKTADEKRLRRNKKARDRRNKVDRK